MTDFEETGDAYAAWSDREKLIYLAGLFDGEGCISISPHTNSQGYQKAAFIEMTSKAGINLFAEVFGGELRSARYQADAKISHRVAFYGRRAYVVVETLQPFLLVKARVAAIFVMFGKLEPRGWAQWAAITDDQREILEKLWLLLSHANARGREAEQMVLPFTS